MTTAIISIWIGAAWTCCLPFAIEYASRWGEAPALVPFMVWLAGLTTIALVAMS